MKITDSNKIASEEYSKFTDVVKKYWQDKVDAA